MSQGKAVRVKCPTSDGKKHAGWICIAEDDDDELGPAHVLPVCLAPTFRTRKECEAWVRDVLGPAGDPLITDDEGESYTYFGHILSKDCPCGPDIRQGVVTQYLHRMTQ